MHARVILLDLGVPASLKQEDWLLVGVDLGQEIFLDLNLRLNLAVQGEKTLWSRLVTMD
jgi:hypothetical protein